MSKFSSCSRYIETVIEEGLKWEYNTYTKGQMFIKLS